MLKSTFEFFHDIGRDIIDAFKWFFSPHAWRLALIVLFNLAFLATLMYVAIDKFGYSRETFARCPGNKNLVFISEFFAFTFFALFAVATVGEVVNWVDEKRKGMKPPSMTAMMIYSVLSLGCGTVALLLILRCS
ncbi:MAG: hypothetical protein U1E85_11650 [Rhodocyclaceae bacterium]